MNIKLFAIIQILLINSQVNSATYNVNTGTYLSASPTFGYACGPVGGYSIILSSQYFTDPSTLPAQPITYYTSQNFIALDIVGGVYDNNGNTYATSMSANSYTGLQNGATFKYGSSQTQFLLSYANNIYYEPLVTSYSNVIDTRSQKDRIKLNFGVNVLKSSINVTSASTVNSSIGSSSCLTINMTNPCVSLVPTTQFKVTLPTIVDPNNASNNIVPLSSFNATTCNVELNSMTTSSKTCTISGDTLTITGLVAAHLSSQSLSLKICDVVRTNAPSKSLNIKFLNTNYTSPSNIYAEGSFNY